MKTVPGAMSDMASKVFLDILERWAILVFLDIPELPVIADVLDFLAIPGLPVIVDILAKEANRSMSMLKEIWPEETLMTMRPKVILISIPSMGICT